MEHIEFQIIIAVDYDDGHLFPLTENLPKCLLPIANQALLRIQLNILESFGAKDILIVTPEDFKLQISNSLSDFSSDVMKVELIAIDEYQGNADCIRCISNRIYGDFLFLSSDVICQFDIGELVKQHRLKCADLTMALNACKIDEPEKKGGQRKVQVGEDDQEYIGICKLDGRIMFKSHVIDVENILKINKSLIHKRPGFNLRTDLVDPGVYVFSKWIVELLIENTKISNVRMDLIPFLIQRQFQSKNYLTAQTKSLQNRHTGKSGLDKWLIARESQHNRAVLTMATHSTKSLELCDYVLKDLSKLSTSSSPSRPETSRTSPSKKDMKLGNNTDEKVVHEEDDDGSDVEVLSDLVSDPIRCFTVICEYTTNYSDGLLQRIGSIPAYLAINRDLPTQQGPWMAQIVGYQKKEQSCFPSGFKLEEKVTIKQCTIGPGCRVSAKCKLNNCVLMTGVEIAEGCTIQNTIIGPGVSIESNCNLNDCQIGAGTKVTSGSKLKSEILTQA